jgi:YHS domain-containing protein
MGKKICVLFCLPMVLLALLSQAQNPVISNIFTADPAPLVYNDTVFMYVGEDTAGVGTNGYRMPHWKVFSSTDMVNWKDRGTPLKPTDFSWAAKDANAAHTIYRNGKFYWYVSVLHKKDANSNGGVAIGVAVADHPTGPYKDAIGKALITNERTKDQRHSWDDLDPAVFIDDDGQAYMFWGNGSCKWAKLKENMIELQDSIHTFKPQNFTEAPWVYKRNGLYYLVYAANFPETIEYCTAKSIEGPWEYKGVIQDRVNNSSTTHPGIIDYKGKSYFFYHDGSLPTGGNFRRGVCIDYLHYNADGSIQKVLQTKKGVRPVLANMLVPKKPDPKFFIYLCFGQSNMEAGARPEKQDSVPVDKRFLMLATMDNPKMDRNIGNWYVAEPPINRPENNMGPVDWFGRTMVANMPEEYRVGVINVSVAGAKIELWGKDTYKSYIDSAATWMQNIVKKLDGNPYKRLVDMAKIAQQYGVIKGILVHQGESNSTDPQWPRKLKGIYTNLMKDLSLKPKNVPLLAGELKTKEEHGICYAFNADILPNLAKEIKNSHVISSKGVKGTSDQFHFNVTGMREFGRRYGVKMLELMGFDYDEAKGPMPDKL